LKADIESISIEIPFIVSTIAKGRLGVRNICVFGRLKGFESRNVRKSYPQRGSLLQSGCRTGSGSVRLVTHRVQTESASKRLQELMKSKIPPPKGIRLGVKKRGCSGLSYTMDYAVEQKPTDEVVQSHGKQCLPKSY
jgi:hypothetical protein